MEEKILQDDKVLLEIKGLKKSFGKNEVLRGIDAEISLGEKVAIIGPSGSGKSTFLRCLNLLEQPTEGAVLFEGENIINTKKINEFRRKMGMVFQHFNLFNNLTVLDNIMFAPVKIGGTYYVDGGVFMNVPVTPIRDMCDKVLALNVYKLVADEYSKNLAAIALRAYHFMFQANTFTELEKADLVIAPDGLGSYSNYELEKAEEIFSAGYFAASKVLEGLEEDEKERYFSFR